MSVPFGLTLGACPACGRERARSHQVSGGFKVTCWPDCGGCGAQSALGLTAEEAAHWWNTGSLRHSPMARALVAAADRRLEERKVQHG